ncbi:hypothetical protein ACUIAK_03695 [Bacillus cytotoxicus]
MLKKGDIHKQIDFLLRHPEPRERAYLFVSDGGSNRSSKVTAIFRVIRGRSASKTIRAEYRYKCYSDRF